EGSRMNRSSKLFALLVVTMMFVGVAQTHMQASIASHEALITPTESFSFSGYDSTHITVVHNSPVNGSTQYGTFNINVDTTSDYGSLNLTLYVEGIIYSGHDHENLTDGNHDISVDSTLLAEGMLNFTLLFEYMVEKESVYLLYFIDNDGVNLEFDLYSPVNGSTISGVVSININATHDFGNLNMTVLVDGFAQSPYDPSLIPSGDTTIIIDTSSLWEGYNNFTLLFEYDFLATTFQDVVYLEYLVDNDGEPITIDHQSPAYGAEVSGIFDLVLLIGSEYDPLNLTLYVEGVVQSDYNDTIIGIREQTIAINTTGLDEGLLNFTLVFEYNVTGENARAEYFVEFVVNNHGAPGLVILGPAESETVTGLTDLWLNITSTLDEVYLNVTVDGVIAPEFNGTLVYVGANNYTLNTSRYENGDHLIAVTVYTAEGENVTIERELSFLDYVRVYVSELSSFNEVSGNQEIKLRLATPYDNATLSLYINGILTEVENTTLYPGLNSIFVNTTVFDEGEAIFKFIVYDAFGHSWTYQMTLIIDNHGPVILRFGTRDAVVIGVALFEIEVDTELSAAYFSVYVDDVLMSRYVNQSVVFSGDSFTFTIDVGNFTKDQHVVKIVMYTEEGERSEVERTFGFATLRIEEMVSGLILLGVAFLIPLYRWRKGQPLRPVIIVDIIFFLVVALAFVFLGITTVPFLIWHVNLPSIWAIGGTLVFTNWVLPIITTEEE
ncbi:MAG: hypothetical protein ACFFEM_07170, partial [Candidatus Thorarchaeota archaeon]